MAAYPRGHIAKRLKNAGAEVVRGEKEIKDAYRKALDEASKSEADFHMVIPTRRTVGNHGKANEKQKVVESGEVQHILKTVVNELVMMEELTNGMEKVPFLCSKFVLEIGFCRLARPREFLLKRSQI